MSEKEEICRKRERVHPSLAITLPPALWSLNLGRLSRTWLLPFARQLQREERRLAVLQKRCQDSKSSFMVLLLCSFSHYPFIQVVIFILPKPYGWFQWFFHNNPWVLVLISKLNACFIFQIFPWLVPGSQSPYFAFFLRRTAFSIWHINPVIDASPFIFDYAAESNDSVICCLKKIMCFLWVSVFQCS